MAAMDSKNASDGDHRALAIIENFTKKMSELVQNIDVLQNQKHSCEFAQIMHMRKPHVKIPVGFLATCVSRVKGICMKIPEVNVYDKSYDNDLE
eukprot:379280_1